MRPYHERSSSYLTSGVLAILCFLGTIARPSWGGTVLGNLSSSLQPGQWAQLVTNGLTYGLIDDGNGHNILQYSDDALWCPITKRFLFVGSGHERPGKFIAYADATNTWSQLPLSAGYIGIHSYDHNAINPATGIVYNRKSGYDSRPINQYDGSWSHLTDIPFGLEVAGALEYFPELEGLIYINGNYGSTAGQALLYRLSLGTWTELSSGHSMAYYHNFGEYSPVHKVMIFGGGDDSNKLYRLDSYGTVTTMKPAPINLGIWNHSVVTVDPVSGDFIVLGSDKSLRSYNPATDTWTSRSTGGIPQDFWNTEGGDKSSISNIVAASITDYGVIMFLLWNEGTPKVYLYKHSPNGDSGPSPPTGLRIVKEE